MNGAAPSPALPKGSPDLLPGVGRDQVIDGLRAVAAMGVVFSHAIVYRFGEWAFPGSGLVRRLADPVAETSVQIFFVISGFIITSLLLREEGRDGRFSLAGFYIRRICRIVPPLAALFAALLALEAAGVIALDGWSMIAATGFSCNVGWIDCQWWVAHTWSLAVEEQFYLVWPLLLALLPAQRRLAAATLIIACLAMGFIVTPVQFHSNYISFLCIGIGAVYALSEDARRIVSRAASPAGWCIVAAAVLAAPLFFARAAYLQLLIPFAIAYLVFNARHVAPLAALLRTRPVQLIGLGSYSLYLWQQVFLARPDEYLTGPPPLILLPLVVAISVVAIEQPFIRIGRRLSHGPRREAVEPAI